MKIQVVKNSLRVNGCASIRQFIRTCCKPQLPLVHAIAQGANGKAIYRHKGAAAGLHQAYGKVARDTRGGLAGVFGNGVAPGGQCPLRMGQPGQARVRKPGGAKGQGSVVCKHGR